MGIIISLSVTYRDLIVVCQKYYFSKGEIVNGLILPLTFFPHSFNLVFVFIDYLFTDLNISIDTDADIFHG